MGDNGPGRLSCRWALARPPLAGREDSWAARSLLSHRWRWGCHRLLRLKGHAFQEDNRGPRDSHTARRRLRGGRWQPLPVGEAIRPGPTPEAGSGHGAQRPGTGASSRVPRGRARRGGCHDGFVRSGAGRPRGDGRGPSAGRRDRKGQDPRPAPAPPTTDLLRPERPWAEC